MENDTKDQEILDHKPKKEDNLYWFSFPAKLRLMILEILLQEHHGLASYASVCKEWQLAVEKKNFRQLKLRRELVKKVWLNIELPKYTCRSCGFYASESWASRNKSIIRKAISKLFSILSTWNPVGPGITLELSAHSLSDSEHWFKNYCFGAGTKDEDTAFGTGNQEVIPKWHDPKHGWIDGEQVVTPDGLAISRLFEMVDLRFPEPLLEFPVVTSFILRRQVRRRLTPSTLRLLFEKLPRLECIIYEPWRIWTTLIQENYDREYQFMIQAGLPKTLKRISLFEDFNDSHITPLQILRRSILQIGPIRHADPKVGTALAHKSRSLEQLSASYIVDARHFFQATQPLWTWNHLQSLVLTSQLLTHTSNCTEISGLLHDAGVAALSMPKLHTMAIWNGRKGEACAFIYQRKDDSSSITWRGTWDLELRSNMVEAWERVGAKFTRSGIRVEKQRLCGDVISSHGDAIYQLDLPCGVIDPISLWQIQREAIGRT
ncbi:hypothetical protein F4677DRAFT_461674 [Hypoxylon crocopeplum]|nr:hypothetical protein F4677DRAFT_461674 [Hypoxylon crocopeplum]